MLTPGQGAGGRHATPPARTPCGLLRPYVDGNQMPRTSTRVLSKRLLPATTRSPREPCRSQRSPRADSARAARLVSSTANVTARRPGPRVARCSAKGPDCVTGAASWSCRPSGRVHTAWVESGSGHGAGSGSGGLPRRRVWSSTAADRSGTTATMAAMSCSRWPAAVWCPRTVGSGYGSPSYSTRLGRRPLRNSSPWPATHQR